MAGVLFVGFDLDKSSNTLITSVTPNQTAAVMWNTVFSRPRGVYHNKGVATLDATITPPADNLQPTTHGNFYPRGGPAGAGYGAVNGSAGYGAATATTRATWATAQGHQLGFSRSEIGHSGAELWLTADVVVQMPNSTLSTAYTPANAWAALFKWGDVEVYFKQTTYAATHTLVFSIRNNGSEVATHTTTSYTGTYLFVKLRVKLDATTGAIEMVVNGVGQSVAYTGQNTVATTSLASATAIYFGPPVADNGTTAYVGFIDNVYLDDAAWPAGRPSVLTFALLADDSLTSFSAVGTGATTVVNALSDQTDAKAARASTSSGVAILTQTPPTMTGYLTDVLGIELGAKRVTTRDPLAARRLEMGYSLSGTQTMGTKSKATPLPTGVAATPPESVANSTHTVEQIFSKSGGGMMTATELATMKIVLKSSS